MSIADRIQSLRKSKGISQEELADKVGVSRQAVSKWESEQSVPDLDKIITMSDYFEVTTDYLLKGIETNYKQEAKEDYSTFSKVLFVASVAFSAMGVIAAITNWIENGLIEDVFGSMIIQVVGVVGYFIGKIISNEKPSASIKIANTMIIAFLPVSMLVLAFLNREITPYPSFANDWIATVSFIVVYFIVFLATVIYVRKKK